MNLLLLASLPCSSCSNYCAHVTAGSAGVKGTSLPGADATGAAGWLAGGRRECEPVLPGRLVGRSCSSYTD